MVTGGLFVLRSVGGMKMCVITSKMDCAMCLRRQPNKKQLALHITTTHLWLKCATCKHVCMNVAEATNHNCHETEKTIQDAAIHQEIEEDIDLQLSYFN